MTETIHIEGKPIARDPYGKIYRFNYQTIKRVVKNKRQCAIYATETGEIIYKKHLIQVYKDIEGKVWKSNTILCQDIKDRTRHLKT